MIEAFDDFDNCTERYARCDCGTRDLRGYYNPYRDPDFERSPFED